MLNNDKRVSFFSLGGIGEIGSNCYAYNIFDENSSQILIVDLGLGFNSNRTPSLDVFYPDISYLKEKKDDIKGLVITHGHEDHIGAIPYLYKFINCPIFATAWTADLIYSKLVEHNLQDQVELIVVKELEFIKIADFKVRWLPIDHSIPDNHLLHIQTPKGDIVHTGDFKLDIQNSSILKNLSALSMYNIEYLFCDSTNVLQNDYSENEDILIPNFINIISNTKAATWITLFSSNIDRIANIIEIAHKLKKKIVPLGRSLNKYIDISSNHGLLKTGVLISENDISNYKRSELIFIVTGSQGEDRAILNKILVQKNHKYQIETDDIVLFSSKVIPGNEIRISKLYNMLADMEIMFYNCANSKIHVSGHPNIEDLKRIYKLIVPKWVVPIHGETYHIKAHSELAYNEGYATFNCKIGDEVELFAQEPYIINKIDTAKLGYEGNRLVPLNDDNLKLRNKIFFEGAVFVSIFIEGNTYVNDLQLKILGLVTLEEEEGYIKKLTDLILTYINSLKVNLEGLPLNKMPEDIRILVRKFFVKALNKKPVVVIHINDNN